MKGESVYVAFSWVHPPYNEYVKMLLRAVTEERQTVAAHIGTSNV